MEKIIKSCWMIADREGVQLRRSFRRTLPKLRMKQMKMAKKAKKLSMMAGALIRDLHRKLSREALACPRERPELFERVRNQKRSDKNKVYSLHEPDILRISKGKAHKQYEFGRKASIAVTKTKGIIVGAMSFNKNVYDSHTLPDVLEQCWTITGNCPSVAICD